MLVTRPLLRRLGRETSGNALIEFGFALPILLAIGGYGIELSNLALINLQVSHAALQLADNAARVGLTDAGTGLEQLREVDVDDVIQGMRLETAGLKLTTFGRVTISSIEESGGKQWLHWQRCVGLNAKTGYGSYYGPATAAPATIPAGAGAPALIAAPPGSGVMLVEINYDYQPLFGTMYVPPKKISYLASMIVRDNRNFATAITNPSPTSTSMTCATYVA